MQFSSCLYTTQGEYICERQREVVEEFYNGPSVMGAPVVKKRLETACYPNNGNFAKYDPRCIDQMNIIAFDQCKTKDPASKSYGTAKVCTIKSPSPNPKLLPTCGAYIQNNAEIYIKKFSDNYNHNATFQELAKDSQKMMNEFSCSSDIAKI